jgi:hypothetical protein
LAEKFSNIIIKQYFKYNENGVTSEEEMKSWDYTKHFYNVLPTAKFFYFHLQEEGFIEDAKEFAFTVYETLEILEEIISK